MSFVAYNQELIDTTIEANRRSNVRSIVVAVVIVIVVITIALLIYFIVRYMLNRNAGSGGQSGGATRCLIDGNCPVSSPVCQTATGLCVQCRDNSQCSGTINKCNVATNSCVQCLSNTDCPTCSECRSNVCRVIDAPPAPTVTNATYVGFNTLRVDWTAVPGAINYVIEYRMPGDVAMPGIDSMLPQTVPGNITTYTVPPGQAACAPSGLSDVTVTTITACGRSPRSVSFKLQGQGC